MSKRISVYTCAKCGRASIGGNDCPSCGEEFCRMGADCLVEYVRIPELKTADEYHEDYGDVFWWRFPIEKPPHFDSPLNSDWDYDGNNYTHFSKVIYPKEAHQS